MMGEKNKNSEIKTLEELSLENHFVLFDTSVIISPLGKNRRNLKLKEKIDFIKENNNFLIEMREYTQERGNFYTIKDVCDEVYDGSFYNIKKRIKEEGQCKNKQLLKFRRLIVKEGEEKRRLIKCFKDNDKIITLDGNEKLLYDGALERYSDIREKYKLKHADFDLLMKGVFLTVFKPVILVSNDYSIFYARNAFLLKDHYLEERDIKFFNRIDFFDFKSLVM